MSTANKAIIRRLVEEGMNKHDLSVLTKMYSDCVYHSPVVGELRGEAYRQFMASVIAAFPDAVQTVEDQLEEGDKVMTRYSFKGTHKGPLMGIPPTGKQVAFTGMCISRIVDGKIVEEWEEWDTLGLLRQLGAVAATVAAKAA